MTSTRRRAARGEAGERGGEDAAADAALAGDEHDAFVDQLVQRNTLEARPADRTSARTVAPDFRFRPHDETVTMGPVKEPFSIDWNRAVAFGQLAAVVAAGGEGAGAFGGAGEARRPRSRRRRRRERGRRQPEWVGGRLAARAAAEALGVELGAVLVGPRREPVASPGWTVSVSHKHALVVALVAKADGATVGVDLEGDAREHLLISDRVLRPEERAVVEALPEAMRWNEVMVRFATKEAVYKALAPRLGRFMGFDEARVEVDGLRRRRG